MPSNRLDAVLSDADRQAVLDAIEEIRTRLPFLIDLSPEERQNLLKFGDKSVAFVGRTLEVARQNPDILPRAFDLDAFARDVALLDALQPIRLALSQLAEHIEDTRFLVGSEAYFDALGVYRYVKAGPGDDALDAHAGELGRRFARRNPAPAPPQG